MMKPVSFFWYLYGSVALALILTITTLFITIDHIEGQNDWQDFARHIQQALLMAELECQTADLNNHCVRALINDHGFDLAYQQDAPQQSAIEQWPHLNTSFLVFRFGPGFQAQLQNQKQFWIRDDAEHLDEAEDDSDPLEMLRTAIAVTAVLLISIALFLYWPVKRLISWLKQLEAATDALAKEDYSVNLPPLNVSPLYQLSQRFNRMVLMTRNNLEEKRLLANSVAHELRTPLSRARLALGLLQRQPDQAMQAELLNDLDRYLDDLEKVSNNSLQLVKLQSSEIHLAEIPLDSWLQEKLRSVQGRSSQLNWQTSLAACVVKTDERFLTLIIDNLLNNAEHYANQQIDIELSVKQQSVVLTIKDDGPGIAKELREKALQPFSRIDESRDRNSGGIGLGLALVNSACQRLNIHLTLGDNQPGLRVTLTLPLASG